jgi:hypothetical protein
VRRKKTAYMSKNRTAATAAPPGPEENPSDSAAAPERPVKPSLAERVSALEKKVHGHDPYAGAEE